MPRGHKPENADLPATPKAAGYARDLAAERGMDLQTAAEAHDAAWPLTYASANALIRALKATPRPVAPPAGAPPHSEDMAARRRRLVDAKAKIDAELAAIDHAAELAEIDDAPAAHLGAGESAARAAEARQALANRTA